ncbi:MAG: hypothetical protein RL676_412, partial [Pseudomonadota bacterium]
MTFESLQIQAALPEILLFGLLAIVLLVDLFTRREGGGLVHGISLAGLVLIGLWQLMLASDTTTVYAMNGLVVADSMSAFLKGASSLAVAVTLSYGRHYIRDRDI